MTLPGGIARIQVEVSEELIHKTRKIDAPLQVKYRNRCLFIFHPYWCAHPAANVFTKYLFLIKIFVIIVSFIIFIRH